MSSIVTFYSYKGGVGRTMAMANVAALLALRGLKVLVIDWDLEAPGLERYFAHFSVSRTKGGLLRLLSEHRNGRAVQYLSHLARVEGKIGTQAFSLDLLPSGRDTDTGYAAMLEGFGWAAYFAKGGGDFIEALRQRWRSDYDVVLIDSRTGISDSGGVCTIQLPDVVVALFTANYQSLYGTRDTMQLAQQARDHLAFGRMHLRVLPVASRFSAGTDDPEAAEWLDRIADALAPFYRDWVPKWAAARQVSEALLIPHVNAYGFGEKLAVVEGNTLMQGAYRKLADLLVQDPPDAAPVLGLVRPVQPASAPATAPDDGYTYDIFVSRADSVFDEQIDRLVGQLVRALSPRLGRTLRVFHERAEVRVGEVWRRAIAPALTRSRLLLAVVTPAFAESWWCRLEWAAFESREEASGTGPLILPVLLRAGAEVPDWVAHRQVLDLSDLPPAALGSSPRVNQLGLQLEAQMRAAPAYDPTWPASVVLAPDEPAPAEQVSAAPVPETPLEADALAALLEQTDNRPEALERARQLLQVLQTRRDFVAAARLAAAARRHAPHDVDLAQTHARALMAIGDYGAAAKELEALQHRSEAKPVNAMVAAQLGLVHKRAYVAAKATRPAAAKSHLLRAIEAYRSSAHSDPANVVTGTSLVALQAAARRRGFTQEPPSDLALRLLDALAGTPESLRTHWDYALAAELHLSLDHWAAFEAFMQAWLSRPELGAFELQSTLAQLTDIWELDAHPQAEGVLSALRARLLSLPGGSAALGPALATTGRLDTVLGAQAHATLASYRTGLDRARSVGLLRNRAGAPVGSCFLVAARALGLALDEPVAITAAHLLASKAHQPASVVFAMAEGSPAFQVSTVLWRSSTDTVDAAVLRLGGGVRKLRGLALADALPPLDGLQPLYLVSHPGGGPLAMSHLELLDHEGLPGGRPATADAQRVHYRGASQPGSTGGPVFNQDWQVVALHHAWSPDMPALNGKPSRYEAGEGLSIQSVVAAVRRARLQLT